MRPPHVDRILGDATEIAVKDVVADFFDDSNLVKQSTYCVIDFIGDKYNYEVKTVQFPFGQYKHVLITEAKLQKYEKEYSKDLYLVYKFSDEAIYYIKYDKLRFSKFEIKDIRRTDRIIKDIPRPHIHIPLTSLKKIREKPSKCLIDFDA
jgi:hypothetical protein